MQLDPMPAEAELLASYEEAASEDYVVEAPGQRATARRLLGRIEAHAKPGRILDLGCWVGYFLDEARRRGWDPLGVEPSQFAARYAERELGLGVVHAGVLEADLSEREFAAVFMGDVIEHVPAAGTCSITSPMNTAANSRSGSSASSRPACRTSSPRSSSA